MLDERGCGRVGPYIARAVHNPGQWGSGRGCAKRLLSDQLFGTLAPKRPQQTLDDRMLSRPELLVVFLAQPAVASAVNCGCAASLPSIVAICESSLDDMRTLVL